MQKLRGTMTLAFALVLLVSSTLVLHRYQEYRSAERAYEQALLEMQELPEVQELPMAELPAAQEETREPTVLPEEQAEYLFDVDLAALRAVNPDVLGWISIPGTQLDYPFLQGEDNQYYLEHTWEGTRNGVGSVFLECQVSPDFSDFNTIIYGHNVKNGSMFGSLKEYRAQSHYEANPYIYIADDNGVRRYEIFAAFEASVVGYTYRLDLTTDEKKQAFLDYSAESSIIETGLAPTVNDSVITLSTCHGKGYESRWVVQAVLTGTFTAPTAASAPEGGH